MDNTINTLEMCAGYGGIGLGIKRIFGDRLRTIAYCELEGFAQANLISKMEKGFLDVAPIWSDLKTFPYGKFHGLVDILIAGYPCQPFSAAGKREGKKDPRHLWPWIADGIRILRPRVCFFENVEGHISLGLREVIGELEEIGYKTAWGIFSAREVGAPHQRKRVFILGYSNSTPWFNVCGEERIGEKLHELGIASSNHNFANSCSHGHDGWPIQDGVCGRSVSQLPQPLQGGCAEVRSEVEGCCDMWPSRPGEPQHEWEPARVVGNASNERRSWAKRQSSKRTQGESNGHFAKSTRSKTKPAMGRDANGSADWVVHAELYTTCDNRTDELRLLGNGVVPATAELAFRTLFRELS